MAFQQHEHCRSNDQLVDVDKRAIGRCGLLQRDREQRERCGHQHARLAGRARLVGLWQRRPAPGQPVHLHRPGGRAALERVPGGSIFYTLHGSVPSFLSAHYAGPFVLPQSGTLRAITYSADFSKSCEAPAIQLTVIPLYEVTATTRGGGFIT